MLPQVRKYSVPSSGERALMSLPEGAKILHVDVQASGVYLWALVDPSRADGAARRIAYYATGEPVPREARYIGTALIPEREFVWHVFEEVQF